MNEITDKINQIQNAQAKQSARVEVVREWILEDGFFQGQKYSESDMEVLLNCTSAILSRVIEASKIDILKREQIRGAGDDAPLSFSESQYIELIKAQRNTQKIAGSHYQDIRDLEELIKETREDIKRLTNEKGKSTECSEARKQLTALIKQKTEIGKQVTKLEKDRSTSTKAVLQLQHKIETDNKKLGDGKDNKIEIVFNR